MKADFQRRGKGAPSPRALRFNFSFQGTDITLLAEHPVAMTVMPSADLDVERPHAAFWYEVQDAQGKALYRGVERSPLDPWVEVPTGDREFPLAHRVSQKRQGFFTLVVPDLEGARSIALFGFKPAKPGDELDTSSPAGEIARFKLTRAVDPETAMADSTPPTTISDTLVRYIGSATVHLFATDNAGGSGVAHTYYRVDGKPQQEGTTVVVKASGRHTLEFWSVDRAGNVEELKSIGFTVVPSTGKRSV